MIDTSFKDYSYEDGVLPIIQIEHFPLIERLLSENTYRGSDRVRAMFRDWSTKADAVAIYRDSYDDESATTKRRLLAFEVSSEKHGLGLGSRLLDEMKWDCEEIRLGPDLGSKWFYFKEGFEESDEGEMKWTRKTY